MSDVSPTGGGLRSTRSVDGDLRLVLNNTLDAVEDGRCELLVFFERHALDTKSIHRLEVIFEELVSNIVRHGFRPKSDQSIRVRARAGQGRIELTFEDDGAPFNPLLAPQPDRYTTLETARIGGRGIPLITSLSTSISYEGDPGVAEDGFRPVNRLSLSVATAA